MAVGVEAVVPRAVLSWMDVFLWFVLVLGWLAGCGAVLFCCAASCARQAVQRTNGQREYAHKVGVQKLREFVRGFVRCSHAGKIH